MKFKRRPFDNPVVCCSVRVLSDHGPRRIYRAGEQVSLRPELGGVHDELKGLPDELDAEVLGMAGENLKVRALHSFYASPTERLVNRGDMFEVSRDEVFHVILPD